MGDLLISQGNSLSKVGRLVFGLLRRKPLIVGSGIRTLKRVKGSPDRSL